ncbi:MAG TPA: hypothetical protein VI653_11875 [Steroidobacteraceae bacterium]
MTDQTEPEMPEVPADNPQAAGPTDTETLSTAEVAAPMLDVHAPHHTVHTWRDFLVHIAAIVIGLVIAVSIEQTVEFFHHRYQREQLVAALKRDGEANRGYIKDDMATAQGVLDWALGQAAALERVGPTGRLTLSHLPHGFIGAPDAGVWPSAKASGVTSLLPASAQNWLEYLAEEYNDAFVSSASASGQLYLAYAALDKAIIGHAIETASGDIDVSTLTAAQRSTAIECLRAIAEQARSVMLRLVIIDAANEYILSTPLDQLDTPEAGKRYMQIFKEKREAHPAANFAFGGKEGQ